MERKLPSIPEKSCGDEESRGEKRALPMHSFFMKRTKSTFNNEKAILIHILRILEVQWKRQ